MLIRKQKNPNTKWSSATKEIATQGQAMNTVNNKSDNHYKNNPSVNKSETTTKNHICYKKIAAVTSESNLASFVHNKLRNETLFGHVHVVTSQSIWNVSRSGSLMLIGTKKNIKFYSHGVVLSVSTSLMKSCPSIIVSVVSSKSLNMKGILSLILVVRFVEEREDHFAHILVLSLAIKESANRVITKELLFLVSAEKAQEL